MKPVYQKVVDAVPDYQQFYTLEEHDASSRALAAEFPDVVELSEIGTTREGRPLLCLKIGEGPAALMLGCPHPNEPIGAMMLEHFSRALAEDEEFCRELGYTWYIVKAWDADSLAENLWLKGPYTISNYTRGFFRPAGDEMVEWTFPIDYKTLHFHDVMPETRAVMDLIDATKPLFIYSLHNSGFGGVYWYQSRKTPEIWEEMRQVVASQDLPLHLGEPEMPYLEPWAPALFRSCGVVDEYDYYEQYGPQDVDPAEQCMAGACSEEYAASRYGTFEFVNEMPYFYDERIRDTEPTGRTRRDVVFEALDNNEAGTQFILDVLAQSRPYMGDDNRFCHFVESFNKAGSTAAQRAMVMESPAFEEQATGAEVFDNLLVAQFYKLLQFAMLLRAHEFELDRLDDGGASRARTVLEAGRDRARDRYEALRDYLEENIHYEAIPIKKLVTVQLACGLLEADYVRTHRP